jgi:phage-related protein
MADGSLKFDTKIDTDGVEKGTKTIKSTLTSFLNSIKGLGASVSSAFNNTSGMEKSNAKIQQLVSEIDQYKDALYYLEKQGLYFGDKEYDEAYQKLSRLEKELSDYKKSLTQVDAAQKKVSGSSNKASKNIDKVSRSASNGHMSMLKMLKMSLLFAVTFQALSAVINGIVTGFQNLAQYSTETNTTLSTLQTALLQLQNSLATAFSPILTAITPALQTMINYLSAAITKIGEFFAALLLGKTTFTKAITAQTDYAKSVKKSTNATEDEKGALAGFDKLNNQSDSKSGAKDATPGMPDPSEMFKTENIDTGILKFVDNLKEKLKPLADAFDRLKVAMKPFAENVGAGLKWLYDNVLVPLASWTVSDLLPAFLDLLGGAFTVLNAVLVTFQPLGLWLWNNFLQPVASWTGGIIITVLKALTDGLYALSDWILKNQGTVQNAALLIGSFFAAFAIVGFLAEAAPFIAALVSAAASGELLAAALAALSTVFGTIFSPITAIAVLIGLLIYSFINLYKNSETFRQSLADLGQTWLTALQPLADFVGTVLSDAWNKILKPAIDFFIKTLLPQLITTFENLWQNVLVPLANFIGTVLQPVFKILADLFTMIWKNIILPLAQAIGTIFAEAWNGIYEILNKTVIPIIKTVISVLTSLWKNFINPIIDVLWKNFKPAFDTVFKGIKTVIDGLKTTLSGVITFITGVFTGNWSKAWEGVKKIFKGIFDALVGIVKTPINLIIDILNGLIGGIVTGINVVIGAINSIKVDVPGWVTDLTGVKDFGFNLTKLTAPKIPKLASGTVVPANYGEFLAVLGDNNREAEVVSPVSAMKQAFKEAMQEMGGSGNSGTMRVTVMLPNGKVLFDEVVKAENDNYNTTGNPVFVH